MKKIIFNGLVIEHFQKPTIKHSYLNMKISSNQEVSIILKTPAVSSAYIEELLIARESWIRKKLSLIESKKVLKKISNNKVLLFGEYQSLDAEEFKDLKQKIQNSQIQNQHKYYDDFYKTKAREYLPLVVDKYATIMKLTYKQLKFRKMKSRWGSCSSLKNITLNTELMKIKKELIEYVVIHELAHLVHMNHSKEFHTFVDFYSNNSKMLRKELKNIVLS